MAQLYHSLANVQRLELLLHKYSLSHFDCYSVCPQELGDGNYLNVLQLFDEKLRCGTYTQWSAEEKTEIVNLACIWMELEKIILTEVTQTRKTNTRVLSHQFHIFRSESIAWSNYRNQWQTIHSTQPLLDRWVFHNRHLGDKAFQTRVMKHLTIESHHLHSSVAVLNGPPGASPGSECPTTKPHRG